MSDMIRRDERNDVKSLLCLRCFICVLLLSPFFFKKKNCQSTPKQIGSELLGQDTQLVMRGEAKIWAWLITHQAPQSLGEASPVVSASLAQA